MKKFYFLFILLALCLGAFAQETTVRFVGQLNGTDYCRLDRVVVTNLTRNWSETLEYPDTIIVLNTTISSVNMNIAAVQGLGQNIPNPFDCETRVELSLSQSEDVRMQLLDVAGKVYAEYNASLDAGMHIFDISAANPQTYLLNAIVGSRQYSIRMVNVGSGCGCSIKYAGVSGGIEAKLTSANEFQVGDNMRYVGYATFDGESVTSATVEQSQVVSQYVTLNFTYYPRPSVETLDATDVTTVSATLNGVVTSDGGLAITSRGFYYGTSNDNLSQNVTATGTGNGFSYALGGLTQGTTYYFRAFATSAAGTSLGETISFATLPTTPPTVATLDVTNVAYTTATLNGSIAGDGGLEITERGFLYGTSADNLSQSANADGTGADFSFDLSGLSVYTTYYYKAFATNSLGTAYGETMQFTTLDNTAPIVVTNEATDITTSSATLNGNIVSTGGLMVTARGFQYGTSADNLSSSVMLGMVNGEISTTLTGLDDNTTYFYRAYASNSLGTSYGEVLSFTTIGIFPPTVVTLTATDVTRTTLTLNGSISSDGNSEITARGFYWGTAENDLPNYVASEQTTADFNETISNLNANTIYYYCASATNIRGTSRGEVLSSRTNPLTAPTVVTNAVTNITYTYTTNLLTATINATITDDGGTEVTARGFYWGTSAENLVNNAVYEGTDSRFSANITGLAYSTTFYYCAYATNSTSTAIGEILSFTTPASAGTVNGHEWVNLGLRSGTLWATCNVGSDTPEGYGDYFSWGETTPKEVYTSSTYTYSDNPSTLPSSADAATANWGSGWRMPTDVELQDLIDNCTVDYTTQNGVTGMLLTGPNGNSIFLPAAGRYAVSEMFGASLHYAGKDCSYWSSVWRNNNCAIALFFQQTTYSYFLSRAIYRYYGLPIRPVCVSASSTASVPSVNTSAALSITTTSAILNGYVVNDGDADVTACGFVYGTSANNLNQTVQCGSGIGFFNYELTGLIAGTTYYIKAFAQNSIGIGYGEIMSFAIDDHYSDPTDYTDGHGYVDLGLPSGTKWATCNVGASTPTDYGNYYAWGETTTKTRYDWSTYRYCHGSETTLTKYCSNAEYGYNGFTDNLTTLEASDDAATANWGSGWRMPTQTEMQELVDYCTGIFATINGVVGRLFIGPNGNSIFLPAAGSRQNSQLYDAGSYGRYWSSSLFIYNGMRSAWYIGGSASTSYGYSHMDRLCGVTIRPVVAE